MPARLSRTIGLLIDAIEDSDSEEEELTAEHSSEDKRHEAAVSLESKLKQATIVRGTRPWIDHILSTVNFSVFEEDDLYLDYVDSCPFKGTNNVLEPIIRILATRDCETVLKFVGMQPLRNNEHIRRTIDLYCDGFRHRGNVAGRKIDKMKTNASYLPRQCDYLHFVECNPELKTSFKKLSKILGRSCDETEKMIPRFEGEIHLVTEAAAIAFLKEKDHAKYQKYGETGTHVLLSSQPVGVINIRSILSDQALLPESDKYHPTIKKRKKNSNDKPFVRTSDFKSYKNALSELQLLQFKLLGIDGVAVKLVNDLNFKKYASMKLKEIQSSEFMDTLDKAQNTLSSNPTATQIDQLIDSWIQMGVKTDVNRCYLGLTNCAILTNMIRSGFTRGDNCHRLKYSDLELRTLEQMCTRTKGFINFDIFLNRQNESKCNKNNKSTYGCKIAHLDVFKCPLTYEGILLSYRHDVLHAPVNKFETIINSPERSKVHRTWNDDHFYCQMHCKHGEKYRVHGTTYDNVDMHLKNAYSLEQLSSSWRQSLAMIGVHCYHTLHIGRMFGAISSNMEGVDYIELSRIGHWSASNDTLALSYASIPNINTIANVAGADSAETYLPIRCLLVPPKKLQRLVLAPYHDELEEIEHVIDRVRQMEDIGLKSLLWDDQALYTCSYIVKLSQYILQAVPFLRQRYPQHDYFIKHQMFHEEMYTKWERTMLTFHQLITDLTDRAPLLLSQLKNTRFSCNSEMDRLNLELSFDRRSTESNSSKDVFSSMCRFLEYIANQGDNGTTTKNTFSTLLNEAVNKTMYNDLKLEITSIKDVLKNLVSVMSTSKDTSSTAVSSKRTFQDFMFNPSEGNSTPRRCTNGKQIEIISLPNLAMIDLEKEPVRKIFTLWTKPFKGQRALMDVMAAPREGFIRFDNGCRSISTLAQRIRIICMILELISKDSEASIQLLQEYCNEQGLTMRQLYNKIQKELCSHDLTKRGKMLSAKDVICNPKYKSASLFWKRLK